MFQRAISRRRSVALGLAFAAVLALVTAACSSDATPAQGVTAAPPADNPVAASAPPQEQAPGPVAKVGNSVGDHIPDFELRLADGVTVSSAALLAERRPAFLFFFATW